MLRRFSLVPALAALAALHLAAAPPEWIWSANPGDSDSRVFRHTLSLPAKVTTASLVVAADNAASVTINGRDAVKNSEWSQPTRADVARFLQPGDNRIEVRARNEGGAAGLLLQLDARLADGSSRSLVTDASWEVSPDGQSGWIAARSLGAVGVQPWGEVLKPRVATPAESISVPAGFQVELLRSAEPAEGSWVSMTIDPKGRLILSPQGSEPMLRVTLDASGHVAKLEPISLPVSGAMGLLHAFGALYVNGQGPDGYHLYRLRDTDGDDQYDELKLLRKWPGGAGEHGAHGIVLGPDQKLYVVNGNFVDLPADLATNSPVRNYADDLVLPRLEDGNGFGAGRKPPGGYVVRLDRDGGHPELFAAGERNTYDIAFSPEGELFGFDSDMEWDWGTPWYRPIRICHLVSGADHGFREGSAKWPPTQADSLPPVVAIGIGSPTGVRFGTGARFPEKYQRALYAMDWSYGRIVAVHLTPAGASFTGTFETFVKGKPLNVTDLEVGPDGALYFTTGGRGTQAGLYRVSYTGAEPTAPVAPRKPTEAQLTRRALETLHTSPDRSALSALASGLSDPDRHVRYAARLGVEALPLTAWRQQALEEKRAVTGLNALLILARMGTDEDQVPLLKALARWPLDTLNEELFLLKLRVIEVSLARHGLPADDLRQLAIDKLGRQYPAKTWPRNRELSQILIALDAPDAVAKTLALRDAAPTQEEQLHYQAALRRARSGWTIELRQRYFAWFHLRSGAKSTSPASYPAPSGAHPDDFSQWFRDVGLEPANGASYDNFLKNIRQQAFASLSDSEKGELAPWVTGAVFKDPAAAALISPPKKREFVRDWKFADLEPALPETAKGRSFTRGRDAFVSAQCLACHRLGGSGGAVGPDLTGLGARYSAGDILRSLIEPSAVVSEQYQAHIFTLADGTDVTGRLLEETADKLVVLTDGLTGARQELKKAAVKSREVSKLSMMPEGLLNSFTRDELIDLVAYLLANGREDAPAFRP